MSSKVVWLSHPLSPETHAYGGGEGVRIEHVTQIAAGDTTNTSRFVLPNHLGIHVDAPRHFFEFGPKLTDYPPEFWIFEEPLIVDVPGEDGYLISSKDVEGALTPEITYCCSGTGYEGFRGDSRYWEHNPGLDPEFGTWLSERFPKVRIVGMDVISVTSRHHRVEGRAAHRALLDPNSHGKPVLVVEDMALENVDGRLERVIVAPLRVWEADGGACTVIGFVC